MKITSSDLKELAVAPLFVMFFCGDDAKVEVQVAQDEEDLADWRKQFIAEGGYTELMVIAVGMEGLSGDGRNLWEQLRVESLREAGPVAAVMQRLLLAGFTAALKYREKYIGP